MQDTMRRKIQMRCKVPAYDEVPGDEDAIMPMKAIDAFPETAAGDFRHHVILNALQGSSRSAQLPFGCEKNAETGSAWWDRGKDG